MAERQIIPPGSGEPARLALLGYSLLAIALCGLLAQLGILLLHPKGKVLCGDEMAFLANTRLLQQHGLTREFLINMKGQAFGPLLNIVHYCASPLTGLKAPQVRIFHLALMVVFLLLIYTLLRKRRPDNAFSSALAFSAIPMLWNQSGGVWSHLPTMIAALVAIILLFGALDRAERNLAAGLLFALGEIGRAHV